MMFVEQICPIYDYQRRLSHFALRSGEHHDADFLCVLACDEPVVAVADAYWRGDFGAWQATALAIELIALAKEVPLLSLCHTLLPHSLHSQ